MFDPAQRARLTPLLSVQRDTVDPSHGPHPVLPLGVPRRPIGSTSLWMVGLGIGALIYAALKLWH